MENLIPEERSNSSIVKIENGVFFMFGGANRQTAFNDFFQLNVIKENETRTQWIKINTDIHIPPRFGAACFYDEIDKSVYIHGGQNSMMNEFFADLYSFRLKFENEGFNRISILDFKNHTIFPIDNMNTPIERNSHSFCLDSQARKFYIFGGGNSSGLLNDLWEFSLDKKVWKNIEGKGKIPSSREMLGAALYFDQSNNKRLLIFGGRLLESISNEIFVYKFELNLWEKYSTLPGNLCSFSSVLIKDNLVIYGGTDGSSFNNNIYIFNIVSKKWYRSKFSPPELQIGLGGRIASVSFYDDDDYFIFGGSAISNDSNHVFSVSLKSLFSEDNFTELNH